MLILSRKQSEDIVIDSDTIVRVLCIGKNKVKLGIASLTNKNVNRYEVEIESKPNTNIKDLKQLMDESIKTEGE